MLNVDMFSKYIREEFTTSTWSPLIYTYIFVLLTHFIIIGGVQGGIEKASKFMMPLLFVIIIALAVYSLWQPEGRDAHLRLLL